MNYATRILSMKLLILIILFGTGCAAKKSIPVGEVPPPFEPTQSVISETRSMIQQHASEEGFKLRQTGADYKRVKKIIERISVASGAKADSFPVYLVETEEDVNAMAVNSSTILVYKLLPQRVTDDDELATVLAHEVAHVLARHTEDDSAESRESAVSVGSSLLGVVTSVAAAAAGVDVHTADLAGDLAEGVTGVVGMGAIVRSYDRQLEYEADHVGLMLMAKAGYDPQAAVSFWAKAEEIFGGEGSSFSFFSTHPSGGDRIDAIREAMPKALEYYQVSQNTKQ